MTDLDRRRLLRRGIGLGATALAAGCAPQALQQAGMADAGPTVAPRVGTIDALRALATAAAPAVDVDGYWEPGDGGGGRFDWVAGGASPEDCGVVIAPQPVADAGRWHRQAHDRLELAWFGARGDGVSDDGPALERAMHCALRTGLPLAVGPGTYLLASDVRATIGEGRSLEIVGDGAVFRRTGRNGTVYLDAEEIGFLPVTGAILPGGDGLTVADAAQVRVGDLVAVQTGLRLAAPRNSSWTATEYARVAAVGGNRLILDAPTRHRVNPNRRLAYRMDGIADRLHYRLFWAADPDGIEVRRNGALLAAGRDYTLSGGNSEGYDIVFAATPPAGTEIVLSTREPIYAGIFRGGRLKVSGLRFETDFRESGGVTFLDSTHLAPAHAHFSGLELIEHNPPVGADGYNVGQSGDLFRVGLIDGLVENTRVYGGRYALMVLRGRNATYRNIVGEDCWHAIASFGAQATRIADVAAIHCVAAIDSHYAFEQHVDGVEGVRCYNGLDHRATGGSLRNATMVDNTAAEAWGFNFGLVHGDPAEDPLLADPQDSPRAMFTSSVSGLANDLEIADCHLAAPKDPEGYAIAGGYVRRLSFRNAIFDGPLDLGGDAPPPVRELALDRFQCRALRLAGVTDGIAARRVTAGQIDLTGTPAGLVAFEDCVFDGALAGGDALILDAPGRGEIPCRFTKCVFRNAARLFGADDPAALAHGFAFEDCIFEIDDANGFG
ncbi:MAG: hypothetical protein R3F55_07665 [Alphaproteobacteria bacterium]